MLGVTDDDRRRARARPVPPVASAAPDEERTVPDDPVGTVATPPSSPSPRRSFRVLQRVRSVGPAGPVIDVQLQLRRTGALVWAHTFSDPAQADELVARIERDLDELDDAAFRRAHRVPADV
jgi:hypothetical protein